MKGITFVVGLIVLAFGVAILAQTQTESVEQELINAYSGPKWPWIPVQTGH
jgi:hypothetical protein